MEILKRKDNESEFEYAIRLAKNKREYDIENTEYFKYVFGEELSPDEARKRFYGINNFINKFENEMVNKPIDYDYKEQVLELGKLKTQINDLRTEINKTVRNKSREENIRELAIEVSKNLPKSKESCDIKIKKNDTDKHAIITLSDIHYGANVNEFNSKYNTSICRDRFVQFEARCVDIIRKEAVKDIYVLGLGDYISGLIHNTIRISNRELITDQVVNIANIIVCFIKTFLDMGYKVYYGDVIGNHSRVVPDKDNCFDRESFDILIREIIKSSLSHYNNFECLSGVSDKIGQLKIGNMNIGYIHGHDYKVNTLALDLNSQLGERLDYIFMGHYHHLFTEEQNGTIIYGSGTMMGTDGYSNKIRKTSIPSQNMYICNNDEITCQHTIRFE